MEWSTTDVKQEDDETVYYLPELGVNIAVKNKS